MTAPRTLPALCAAVVRVLVARGESAEALVVHAYTFGGGTTAHIDAVACNASVPWIDVRRARRRDAIAGAWQALAATGAALATALDGAVDRGAGGLVTGGAARRVRAAGAVVWREMEGGR